MKLRARTIRIAAAVALALPFAAGVAPIPSLDADAAFAQQGNGGNGNGNGGNGGNGNGNGGNGNGGNGNRGNDTSDARGGNNGNGPRGQGAIASELRNANAANANINAMLNADPASNVGRLNILREQMLESEGAYEDWREAYTDYVTVLNSRTVRTVEEIDEAINVLDEVLDAAVIAELELERDQAINYDQELARLAALSNDAAATYEASQNAETDALLAVTDGRELSDEARAELRRRLTN